MPGDPALLSVQVPANRPGVHPHRIQQHPPATAHACNACCARHRGMTSGKFVTCSLLPYNGQLSLDATSWEAAVPFTLLTMTSVPFAAAAFSHRCAFAPRHWMYGTKLRIQKARNPVADFPNLHQKSLHHMKRSLHLMTVKQSAM